MDGPGAQRRLGRIGTVLGRSVDGVGGRPRLAAPYLQRRVRLAARIAPHGERLACAVRVARAGPQHDLVRVVDPLEQLSEFLNAHLVPSDATSAVFLAPSGHPSPSLRSVRSANPCWFRELRGPASGAVARVTTSHLPQNAGGTAGDFPRLARNAGRGSRGRFPSAP